jgi:signal transduction histidine kinase
LNVEDNRIERDAITQILRAAGYQVWETGTVDEAIHWASQGPDLVLLGIGLQDDEWFAICSRLKNDPATRSIPILLLSPGFSCDDDVVNGLAGGADAYLAYPVSEAALLAVVNSLLRSREAEQNMHHQNQQLQKKDRDKDQFLAMVAHELRNPLAALLNASRILRAEGAAERAKREWVAGLVERQTHQLVRLTNDLLDLSRIDRDKLVLQKQPVDLGRLVETAAGDYLSRVEAAGLSLHLELPRRPVWVDADADRLTQVVFSLVHNAIKFADPGGRIMIRLSEERERRQVVLAVQDTGIGIEPELVPGLFDVFAQDEASRNRNQTGLGLGLALVKALVELHGGSVHGASEGWGTGSTFTVRLPLASERPAASDLTGLASSSSQESYGRVAHQRQGEDSNHHSDNSGGRLPVLSPEDFALSE